MTSIKPTAVDEVSLTFLVDNCIEWMTKLPPGFSSEVRLHMSSPDVPVDELTGVPILDLDNYCCGAHGFSVLITTKSNGSTHQILFDTGPEESSIARNIAALKVPLNALETIVLSHWHRDHSGGILKVLSLASSNKPIEVDLHPSRPIARGIAPPPTFQKVVARLPEDPSFDGIEKNGGKVVLHDEPHTVGGGTVYVSGEIPRVCEWEAGGLLGSVRWVPKEDVREAVGEEKDGFKWVAEPQIMDERYVAIDVIGKGLVLLSACSHAGICNVINDAVTRFLRPIYMVVGGLHLAGPELQDRIEPTIKYISESLRPAPTYILPMHCTGFNAKVALEAALGQGCVPAGVGIKVDVQGDPEAESRLFPPVIVESKKAS